MGIRRKWTLDLVNIVPQLSIKRRWHLTEKFWNTSFWSEELWEEDIEELWEEKSILI